MPIVLIDALPSPTQAFLESLPSSLPPPATAALVSSAAQKVVMTPGFSNSLVVAGAVVSCLSIGAGVSLAVRRLRRWKNRDTLAKPDDSQDPYLESNGAARNFVDNSNININSGPMLSDPRNAPLDDDNHFVVKPPSQIFGHARRQPAVAEDLTAWNDAADKQIDLHVAVEDEEKRAAASETLRRIEVEFRMRSFCFATEMAKAKRNGSLQEELERSKM